MTKRRTNKRTFTKIAVKWILITSMVAIILSYVLAFMGREQIAETLSIEIVKVILGTILIYCLKSYFETKAEETVKLQREEMKLEDDTYN